MGAPDGEEVDEVGEGEGEERDGEGEVAAAADGAGPARPGQLRRRGRGRRRGGGGGGRGRAGAPRRGQHLAAPHGSLAPLESSVRRLGRGLGLMASCLADGFFLCCGDCCLALGPVASWEMLRLGTLSC